MKIAFSGSHGTGKTTNIFNKCYELKKNYKNVGISIETARECPLPINKEASVEAQFWILTKQIESEIRLCAMNDVIVCDRTVADTCAYSYFVDRNLYELSLNICQFYINTYDWVYFKLIKNNPYLIDDGIRDTDKEFQQEIEDKILEIYTKLKYNKITYI